jgi:hypothetical protein
MVKFPYEKNAKNVIPVPRITSVGYILRPSALKAGFSKNSYKIFLCKSYFNKLLKVNMKRF